MGTVDLNADLGESFGRWTLGDDAAMSTIVTSANIACGFHAGDPLTLIRTCRMAVENDVTIGAQVGYRDLAGFGRRFVDVDAEDLTADVLYQIGALDGIAHSVGGRVAYLKPHGALYHATVDDDRQAGAVVAAVLAHGGHLPILGFPGSALLARAEAEGVRTVTEWFVDRGYDTEGRLLPRRLPEALITDPEVAAKRAVRAAEDEVAESFCLHGDTPGAVVMGQRVRDALIEAGVGLAPFVNGGDDGC
ncbi:MAG: LamB/YcsF family protein [Propionibacteriales bacterium]|nr:LamB/YcsF family protein [Propionibacteriales bacterium]